MYSDWHIQSILVSLCLVAKSFKPAVKKNNNLDRNSLVLNFKTKILSWQASIVFKSEVYGIFMKVFRSKKLINPNLKIKNQEC